VSTSHNTGFGVCGSRGDIRGLERRPRTWLPSTRIDYFFSKADDEDVDADEAASSWLSWMRGGKPRGTNQVRLREAAELGGVPRSDRYMSKDWFHNTVTLPNSAILRDIKSPVLACCTWAVFWSFLHHHLRFIRNNVLAASNLYIPTAPHSLTMSALGLLLVFRTNSAYQRFAEGREIWERIINTSRDLYRYIMMYEDDITIDKRRRLQRLLAAFPYLLRHRIRPNLVMRRLDDDQYTRDPQNTILLYQDFGVSDLDEEAAKVAQTEEVTGQSRRKMRTLYWVDKRTLPWRLLSEEGALEKCARAQNRPLWVVDRMAMELRSVPDSITFTNRERMTLIALVDKLSHCIGAAERIHQTVR
jgi:predicted membrane chloride channel (bestrophin family)